MSFGMKVEVYNSSAARPRRGRRTALGAARFASKNLFYSMPKHWCYFYYRTLKWVLICLAFASILIAHANQVTYQVNMSVQRELGNFNPAAGDTVVVSGTFSATDWTTTSALTASVTDSNIYAGIFNNNVTTGNNESHKFIINPGGNSPANKLIWESRDNRFFQVMTGDQSLPVVYFNDLTNVPTPSTNNFITGADFSLLPFFESNGIAYKDNGVTQDVLTILKKSRNQLRPAPAFHQQRGPGTGESLQLHQ